MEMLIVVAIIVALAGIGGWFLMGALAGGQKDAAFAQTKVLTSACQQYAIKHGNQFPESLEKLLEKDEQGFGPYLESEDAIYDPWSTPTNRRKYQYNKEGPKNKGLKPDIWTTDPKDNTEIGNWPKTVK
jgi:type II secretory pathway pseudopilin PulG